MDPLNINLRYVKSASSEFLKKFHPTLKIPVPIEDIVELKLNIRVILIQRLIRDFGVNAFINHKFDSIVIDENIYNKQPERTRFTIAEEIGHLVLHKNWYQENGPKGFEDYLDWQEKLDPKLFNYIERQAKTFGGMVLMPEILLKQEWDFFAKQTQTDVPCSVYELPDTFPELAQKFEVTADSLLARLNFLKLVILPDGFWKKARRRK